MIEKRISDCRLYGFIDAAYLAGRDPAALTRALIAGGVDLIQVRAKKYSHSRRLKLSRTVVEAAAGSAVPVIINDDIEAALQSGAHGVHLGQEDWQQIPRVERLVQLIKLQFLGLSTHSFAQALDAEREGADYIGVGPVFPTGTKPDVKPVGLDLVQHVATRVKIPFFAIGGITLANLNQVTAAGAHRVAVVSAILTAADVAQATAAFKEKLP